MFECVKCLKEIKEGDILYIVEKTKFLVEYNDLYKSKTMTAIEELSNLAFCEDCYSKIKWNSDE